MRRTGRTINPRLIAFSMQLSVPAIQEGVNRIAAGPTTRMSAGIITFHIIIDDGSHINEHVIETFNLLFPKLKDGGVYVIEDTQTSYWEEYGGDGTDLNNPKTMMNYFKGLTDCLNHQEFITPAHQPDYFDKKIVSMHFYHNLIFIYKGDNNEQSFGRY